MIKTVLKVVFVLTLLGIISYLWFENENKDKELIVVNGKVYELLSREVEVIEVEKVVTEYKEGNTIYVEVEVPVEVFIPIEIDTMEVLEDYYSTRVYSDTLKVDSLGYVAIIDTISQNKIIGRWYDAHINERTIKETITVKDLPKTQIWAGLGSSTNLSVSGNLSVITKRQRNIGVDVGLYLDDDKLNPYVGVRYLWRIR
jgi:hypothetical protein